LATDTEFPELAENLPIIGDHSVCICLQNINFTARKIPKTGPQKFMKNRKKSKKRQIFEKIHIFY